MVYNVQTFFCLQEHGSEEITIVNPAQFPDRSVVSEYLEPMVLGTILAPDVYIGKIMTLCLVRRKWEKCRWNIEENLHLQFNLYKLFYFSILTLSLYFVNILSKLWENKFF